jgi:hypothetical protein
VNINLNPFDIDFSQPVIPLVKSGGFLMIGTFLENIHSAHLPPIFIEIAKVLAYLGASVAFFKFIGSIFFKKKDEN